ncbi:MAG: hypothetical protein JO157_11785 [Acetobacteraceae bacterium]|nr:hypothetical protein [Acetobacteraceae bacterium]
MTKPTLAIIAASLALVGCTDTMLSKDSIRNSTALALHQPADAVIIADRRYDGVAHTSYAAWTPHGVYNCVIKDGSASAVKLTDPPRCSPE